MTAVEFLVDNFHYYYSTKWNDIVEQAKEMEKQQQGYSEEDMIEFGKFIFKNTLLVNVKGVDGILKQFKNK